MYDICVEGVGVMTRVMTYHKVVLHLRMPMIRVGPQAGPQTAFMSCPADIVIFGGAPGGGKSNALLREAARWIGVPHYAGVLFRRTSTDLKKAGGLWDKGSRMYRTLGARVREGADLDARWPNGACIQFRGIEHEKDVEEWQGTELDFVGMDEGDQFSEYQFWYLISRLRGTSGIKSYIRVTVNPNPDSWVRGLIAWWIGPDGRAIPERDGAIRWLCRVGDDIKHFASASECQAYLDAIGDRDSQPHSLTFIHSSMSDNPALMAADPGYRGRLAMQDAVTRARLLDENWDARPQAGAFFSRMWFNAIDAPPPPDTVHRSARGWDLAGGEPTSANPNPDYTWGVRIDLLKNGHVVVSDVVGGQLAPSAVDALLCRQAQLDGPGVVQCLFQDPGGAGKRDVAYIERLVRAAAPTSRVSIEVANKSKVTYIAPFSARVDPRMRMNQIQASIVRAPWNAAWLSELEAFPSRGVHDDRVDATARAWLELDRAQQPFSDAFVRAMRRMG